MKIIAVVAVAGRIHIVSSRAPDLARRDLAARYPGEPAALIWVGLPPKGVGASHVAERIACRLGAAGAHGPIAASVRAARRAAVFEVIIRPALDRLGLRLRRRACRHGRFLAGLMRGDRQAFRGGA